MKSTIWQRQLRVGFIDLNPKVIDTTLMQLEKHLQCYQNLNVTPCLLAGFAPKDYDAVIFRSVDSAFQTIEKHLRLLQQKIFGEQQIVLPFIVIAPLDPIEMLKFFPDVLASNWYFDMVNPDHLMSLPIRLANLIRIRDHMLELKRYHEEIMSLHQQVADLEQKFLAIKNNAAS